MSDDKPTSALVQLVLARWRSFYREPGVLFWSFGFPIVIAIALGVAFRDRAPAPASVAVVGGSEATKDALRDKPDLSVQELDEAAARRGLRTGKIDIVVLGTDPPTYELDPTRLEARYARAVVDTHLQEAAGRKDVVRAADRPVTEPGSRYIDFLVPGLLGTGLMQGGLWGVGYVIVEMRTRRLMKRLLATPMKKREFLLAFVLARALFLLVELPVLVGFASLVFGVPVNGSLLLLAVVAVLGSLTFAGIGLLVASRAENVQTASGLINVAAMPMLITSGTFFSSSKFPESIQPLIQALPLTALNDALRAVLLDGKGVQGVALELVILLAWGLGSFLLALRIFRWR